MDIDVISRKENPSLHREEVEFRIFHDGESTPSRETVAAKLAAILNTDRGLTVIREINSEFGRSASVGYANLYESEDFLITEPGHILVRNGLKEEK